MCTYPFAKKALTLYLARSEGHERYFSCNLMQCKVLASSYQHLIAEAPSGLIAIADRLSYLHRLVEDHQNEQSINLDSLRELALFFLSERQLVNPQIGVNPDGLVQVEWSIGERGTLAMVFLPSGFIRFAAISAPAQRGVESTRISGTLPKSETMGAIRPFTDRLAHS